MSQKYRNNIRFLRQVQNLTIKQLAKELNMSVGLLSALENEKRVPRIDVAHDIADNFNISLTDLFFRGSENKLERIIHSQLNAMKKK
jgi:transcriptional regulator with XRE-family HTH domain